MSESKMVAIEERYRTISGQPMIQGEGRIILDVRFCEPSGKRSGQAAVCPGSECNRMVFRNVGDDPWVDCVCGTRFNANFTFAGSTPWPEPREGGLYELVYLGPLIDQWIVPSKSAVQEVIDELCVAENDSHESPGDYFQIAKWIARKHGLLEPTLQEST